MKKIITILAFVLFAMFCTSTVAFADVKEGQKIFKKKFRKKCGFSGVRFARSHSQSEWEELYDEGKFPKEAKKICPRLQLNKIKSSWWKHVYEFSYKYAKDGAVPKC